MSKVDKTRYCGTGLVASCSLTRYDRWTMLSKDAQHEVCSQTGNRCLNCSQTLAAGGREGGGT